MTPRQYRKMRAKASKAAHRWHHLVSSGALEYLPVNLETVNAWYEQRIFADRTAHMDWLRQKRRRYTRWLRDYR